MFVAQTAQRTLPSPGGAARPGRQLFLGGRTRQPDQLANHVPGPERQARLVLHGGAKRSAGDVRRLTLSGEELAPPFLPAGLGAVVRDAANPHRERATRLLPGRGAGAGASTLSWDDNHPKETRSSGDRYVRHRVGARSDDLEIQVRPTERAQVRGRLDLVRLANGRLPA